MDMKPATFTLEVKGLNLPDDVREDISQALNNTLLRKIGELDLRTKNTTSADAAGSSLFGKVVRIDGGEIMKLLARKDFGLVFQRSLENTLVVEAGIEKITPQLR